MRTTTKTLIAVGLLCAVAWFVFSLADDPPPRSAGDAVPDNAAGAAPATSSAAGLADAQREAAPTADAPVAWLEHPFRFEVEVLVVDPTGLPVQDHRLCLAPPECTLNDAPHTTGPDGRVALSWRSRQPNGEVVLADERGTLRRIAVQHGTKVKVALPGEVRRDGPRIVWGKSRSMGAMEETTPGTVFNAHVDEHPDFRAGLHPHVAFGTAGALVGARASTVIGGTGMQLPEFPLASTVAAKPLTRIAGTVFGEEGKPAARVPVVLLRAADAQAPPAAPCCSSPPLRRGATDDAGQFVFEGLTAAEFRVRAGGTAVGLATCPAITTTGTTPVTLNLRRDACVRGRVVSAAGGPIADATIAWRAFDGSWCDSTGSAADGTFVLANLPGTVGTVLLWAPGTELPLPVAIAANVLADTGTGKCMPQAEEGQSWRLARLTAGWYRVELHTAATGWFDAGRHWVDGHADCDLGRVLLPAPGTVRFVFAPGSLPGKEERAFEVCALRADVDVRIEVSLVPETGLLLPAGDYVLAWKNKEGATRLHRFTASGGKEVVVTPGR